MGEHSRKIGGEITSPAAHCCATEQGKPSREEWTSPSIPTGGKKPGRFQRGKGRKKEIPTTSVGDQREVKMTLRGESPALHPQFRKKGESPVKSVHCGVSSASEKIKLKQKKREKER